MDLMISKPTIGQCLAVELFDVMKNRNLITMSGI